MPDRRRQPRGGRRAGDMPGRAPSVVIVERYEAARRPCVRYLDHFNFDTHEASNPEDAVALLNDFRPAVLLVEERSTPAMQALRVAARAQAVPVIALTIPFADNGQEESADAEGTLTKPFSLRVMLDEVRRVLRAQMQAGLA